MQQPTDNFCRAMRNDSKYTDLFIEQLQGAGTAELILVRQELINYEKAIQQRLKAVEELLKRIRK